MAHLMPSPRVKFYDTNGSVAAGFSLYSYQATTSTPLATYTSQTEDGTNANPVVLDSNGEAVVWLGSNSYKFVLKNLSGATVLTADNVKSINLSSIITGMLADGILTADVAGRAKMADLYVNTAKLDDLSVSTGKLIDLGVTTAKIAASNVTTAKLADSNVTTAKIADANVTTAKIADANVTTAKLAANAVTAAKIASATITTSEIAAAAAIKMTQLISPPILYSTGTRHNNTGGMTSDAYDANSRPFLAIVCGTVACTTIGSAVTFTISESILGKSTSLSIPAGVTQTIPYSFSYVLAGQGALNFATTSATSGTSGGETWDITTVVTLVGM